MKSNKPELPQEGILFRTQFPSLGIFINKKLDFEKTKATQYTTFKTDILEVVLVFSISNFFTIKNSKGRKFSAVSCSNSALFVLRFFVLIPLLQLPFPANLTDMKVLTAVRSHSDQAKNPPYDIIMQEEHLDKQI